MNVSVTSLVPQMQEAVDEPESGSDEDDQHGEEFDAIEVAQTLHTR